MAHVRGECRKYKWKEIQGEGRQGKRQSTKGEFSSQLLLWGIWVYHAGTGSQALGDEAVGSLSTSLSLVVVWGLFRQARREIPSISGLLTALMQSRLSQPKNSSRQRIQGTGCWKSSGACENGVMDKTSFSHTHLPNSIVRVNLGYLTSCWLRSRQHKKHNHYVEIKHFILLQKTKEINDIFIIILRNYLLSSQCWHCHWWRKARANEPRCWDQTGSHGVLDYCMFAMWKKSVSPKNKLNKAGKIFSFIKLIL